LLFRPSVYRSPLIVYALALVVILRTNGTKNPGQNQILRHFIPQNDKPLPSLPPVSSLLIPCFSALPVHRSPLIVYALALVVILRTNGTKNPGQNQILRHFIPQNDKPLPSLPPVSSLLIPCLYDSRLTTHDLRFLSPQWTQRVVPHRENLSL